MIRKVQQKQSNHINKNKIIILDLKLNSSYNLQTQQQHSNVRINAAVCKLPPHKIVD